LDRKLSTEVVVMEIGMIISGTYFGTQEEYDALNFESRLAQNATVTVHTIDNWLGAVTNWAENEALQLIGGVVSRSFIPRLKRHQYLPVYQSGPFYSKSLAFTPDTLIPYTGIENLFNYLETATKGTLAWFVIFDLEAGKVGLHSPLEFSVSYVTLPRSTTSQSTQRHMLIEILSYVLSLNTVRHCSDLGNIGSSTCSHMVSASSPFPTLHAHSSMASARFVSLPFKSLLAAYMIFDR
jgi:hypothetical protein